ncbi:hypothetical protein [Pseudorhodoplanes sinuspersici]|uniref:Uncharacterized protein n=1 Tax=Pseudorhodoplanes sinuspersici TaxID=1235591 RepID=A0A1W6ZV59_9HYPH|nr:hypothetical protein [Pseudorhodoplanes sinuspersici]ARQ01264.1 hypothetical protein CAK95_20820 [Pseudorhodoplanes sinuspersici]RKE72940.1 hypothetical protein DFP91_0813 [Pseudorhodoplanes sinuspersici]
MLFAFIATTGPSSADVLDVVRGWDLLGTFAVNCARPPSPDNAYARYVQREAAVFLDRDVGSNQDSLAIVDASALPDGTISIVIDFGKAGTRTNILAKDAAGRIRAMANHDSKGRFSVRNGVVLSLKRPTPWQERCAP